MLRLNIVIKQNDLKYHQILFLNIKMKLQYLIIIKCFFLPAVFTAKTWLFFFFFSLNVQQLSFDSFGI